MTDPNKDLIGRIASRVPDVSVEAPPAPRPRVANEDWNAPIDRIQADSMTLTQVIRGEIADAKAHAAQWEPRPYERNADEEEVRQDAARLGAAHPSGTHRQDARADRRDARRRG